MTVRRPAVLSATTDHVGKYVRDLKTTVLSYQGVDLPVRRVVDAKAVFDERLDVRLALLEAVTSFSIILRQVARQLLC